MGVWKGIKANKRMNHTIPFLEKKSQKNAHNKILKQQ
jgi:hypothetical protein